MASDPARSDGPRVVVTGVSQGIGRAVMLTLAGSGARVAGVYLRDHAGARELGDQLSAEGRDHLIRSVDTGDHAAVDAFAAEVSERWGGIDVWVNNAARLLVKPFLQTTPEDWQHLLGSNLMGYVNGCRAAAREMTRGGGGTIVNVSSVVFDQPPTDLAAYVTAKGGIAGLTRALAVELGPHGITVNAIAPGATETPLNTGSWTDEVRDVYRNRIPLGRIAEPQEIADAIVLLTSPAARYITGQLINADGGLTLDGSVGHQPT